MRVGITLPQFRDDAEPALNVARRAEVAGIDGVFVFDHLWPLGRPDRPALHSTTLLGALVAETRRAVLGTLVARVGLVPDAVLVHVLTTLHRMAEGRFIAGLGTGDRANRAENLAYGLPFPPAAERIAAACRCARRLREQGVRTWMGGRSGAIRRAAASCADAWNGWGLPIGDFAQKSQELRSAGVEATWAGQVAIGRTPSDVAARHGRLGPRPGLVAGTVEDVAAHLRALAGAGATWAVCAPIDVGTDPEAVDGVAAAAALARATEQGGLGAAGR